MVVTIKKKELTLIILEVNHQKTGMGEKLMRPNPSFLKGVLAVNGCWERAQFLQWYRH